MNLHTDRPLRRSFSGRMAIGVFLVVALVAVRPATSEADGIITHDAVVQRAIDRIDSTRYPGLAGLLHDYPDVVYYGAMFPDWSYAIGEGGDFAEIPHDTLAGQQGVTGPFRAALIANLVPYFKNPRSEDDRKAIAFLLGVISHQDADGPYHFGDGTAKGLQPLAESEGVPHWAFELGTDLYMLPTLRYGVDWYLPVEPILAAYRALDPNHTYAMSAEKVRLGRAAQQIANVLEALAAAFIDPCAVFSVGTCRQEVKKYYPLIESYPAGGLDNAADRTARLWQDTWDRLTNYGPVPVIDSSGDRPGENNGVDG